MSFLSGYVLFLFSTVDTFVRYVIYLFGFFLSTGWSQSMIEYGLI